MMAISILFVKHKGLIQWTNECPIDKRIPNMLWNILHTSENITLDELIKDTLALFLQPLLSLSYHNLHSIMMDHIINLAETFLCNIM